MLHFDRYVCGVLLFLQYKIVKDKVEEEEESYVWAALSFLMCMMFFSFLIVLNVKFWKVQFQLNAATQL